MISPALLSGPDLTVERANMTTILEVGEHCMACNDDLAHGQIGLCDGCQGEYRNQGYQNRSDYLSSLSEGNGVDLETVMVMADLLGPSEDFDGLVTALEEFASGM